MENPGSFRLRKVGRASGVSRIPDGWQRPLSDPGTCCVARRESCASSGPTITGRVGIEEGRGQGSRVAQLGAWALGRRGRSGATQKPTDGSRDLPHRTPRHPILRPPRSPQERPDSEPSSTTRSRPGRHTALWYGQGRAIPRRDPRAWRDDSILVASPGMTQSEKNDAIVLMATQ